MTDSDHALEAIADTASRLVPELTDRLRRHALGEIEVAHGDLRLRVATWSPAAPADGDVTATASAATAPTAPPAGAAEPAAPAVAEAVQVSSPAVGFFVYADGLGPGLAVAKGDALGHIEMLGVRHDVRAPRGGTVRHLVAESGEPVEYGQVVVELEPAEGSR